MPKTKNTSGASDRSDNKQDSPPSSQWLPRKQHAGLSISKSSTISKQPERAPVSELSKAFFSGKIRDRSTKESVKAAEEMHYLQRAAKNPGSSVIDNKVLAATIVIRFAQYSIIDCVFACAQGRKVNVKKLDASKACAALSGKMPADLVKGMLEKAGLNAQSMQTASSSGASKQKNPLREDVRQDIIRRAEALFENGQTFEEGMTYEDKPTDVEHARLIIQGIDPFMHESARKGHGGFFQKREIEVTREHWVASMQGICATKNGCVYVHSNGAITALRRGQETSCKCGTVHSMM